MTNRERLEENYEDALFAMWMNDFAQRRGEQFLEENERLQNDPEAAVPEKLQRKNLSLIYRELRRNSQHFVFKRIGKAALHFAAAVAIMAALFGAAYALSPEFRAGTLNVLMQLDERAASFQLVEDESASPEMPALMPNVTVGWLPEGYVGVESSQSRLVTTINCANNIGDFIHICVYTDNQTLYNFDIEDVDTYEEVLIQGHSALLVRKDNLLRISWAEEITGTYVYVSSDSIDKNALTQVAENISISW